MLSSGALNPTAAEFVPGGLPPALAAKISAVNEQLRNPSAGPKHALWPSQWPRLRCTADPFWLQHEAFSCILHQLKQ